jgi:hypothetical protein
VNSRFFVVILDLIATVELMKTATYMLHQCRRSTATRVSASLCTRTITGSSRGMDEGMSEAESLAKHVSPAEVRKPWS